MLAANLISPPDPSAKLISVVAPAYNEEDVLPAFHKRLCAVFDGFDHELEVIYVNDGSSDQTLALLHAMRVQDPRITLIDLSRNFGKEIAMTAGLDHASGDAIVVIDTDLQDPPELIPEMIRLWLAGHDVVYAQRTAREGESWVKRATASAFYQVIQRLSRVKIPQDTGDFRLMSRRAVDALLRLREHHRFMKGLFAWVGFSQIAVPYRRGARFAGNTKWNYWKLWNFAIEGITSFTTVPLKIASYMGLFISLFAFAYAAFIIYKTLMFGDSVQGYPSLMVVVLMLGGIQLASLGIIGEYLGRMFNETKQRPLYLTQAVLPSRHAEQRAAGLNSGFARS